MALMNSASSKNVAANPAGSPAFQAASHALTNAATAASSPRPRSWAASSERSAELTADGGDIGPADLVESVLQPPAKRTAARVAFRMGRVEIVIIYSSRQSW